jgi:hypothetical protein
MVNKLKKHITHRKGDDDDESTPLEFDDDDDDFSAEEIKTDPRWDGLQNIIENN